MGKVKVHFITGMDTMKSLKEEGKKLLDKVILVIYSFWSLNEKRRFIMWNDSAVYQNF